MIDWNAIVVGQREAWVLGATAALGLAFGVLAQGSRFCFLRALQAAFARTQPGPLRLFAAAMATAVASASQRRTLTGEACRSATAPKRSGETNAATPEVAKA